MEATTRAANVKPQGDEWVGGGEDDVEKRRIMLLQG